MLDVPGQCKVSKKIDVICDVFWEWIADSMLEEMVVSAKSGQMFGRLLLWSRVKSEHLSH